ncbi:hypothetical protein [Pacificoceanicola onchidii]|uniref:hypothetical protein n=1 Tax=Pacificoceanicola onchidii TaxID=2562685 RepID=UPI0010A5F71A|nr:hypothetical protein [Pacificoceanicola onchidii]
MSQFSGFLVRNAIGDTGNIPRSGTWTQSPDIIPAGTVGIDPKELVQNYDKVYNSTLAQGQSNFLYVRAKNLTKSQLTKKAFLFQAPQSLFLFPHSWYAQSNLIHYTNPLPSGDQDQVYQEITAAPGQVVATNAYQWKPTSTEHHCLIAVVTEDFDSLQASFPPNVTNSTSAFATWIFENGNIGWHNVNIAPMTSTVIEGSTEVGPMISDATVTFTMTAENVPVGAACTFTSTTASVSGEFISQGWTTVPVKPGYKDPTINPTFQIGARANLKKGDIARISYRTDFKGKAVPPGFKQAVSGSVPVTNAAAHSNTLMSMGLDREALFEASVRSAFAEDALFQCPDSGKLIQGRAGLNNMLGDFGGGGGRQPIDFISVIGSDTTLPILAS